MRFLPQFVNHLEVFGAGHRGIWGRSGCSRRADFGLTSEAGKMPHEIMYNRQVSLKIINENNKLYPSALLSRCRS